MGGDCERAARPRGFTAMRIGTQLYVYHQYWAERGEQLADHLPETLAEVRAAGLEGFEGSLDLLGTHEEAFAAALAGSGLVLCSLYAGGNLHDEAAAAETIAKVLELAPRGRALGAAAITFNPQPRLEPRKTDAELARQARGLEALGAELRRLGLALNVHTHSPEMVDDAREFRSLLDLTDPALVGLCLDTHWVYRGGGDVPVLTRRYLDRIGSLHVRQSHGGVWAETFGDGDLDHRPIAEMLRERGYDGWVNIELAWEHGTPHTRPLVECLTDSAVYAREVFRAGK